MGEFNWDALIKEAEEAGLSYKLIAVGRYPDAEVRQTQVKATQGGKKRIGVLFKVHGGPSDGETVWANQNIPVPGKDKPGASVYFLKFIAALGLSPSGDLEKQLGTLVGQHFDIDVTSRTYNDTEYRDVAIKGKAQSDVPAPPAPPADAPAASPPDDDDDDDDDDDLGDFEERPV